MMKYTILSVIILCASAFGGCLNDNDYWHSDSDYSNRYFSYPAKSAAKVSTSSDLTFMTYNLQSGYSSSCVSNPNTQASMMSNADYVGTQETVQGVDTRCNCNIPKIISDVTGMSTRFMMTIPFRSGQYGIALGTTQTILETKNQLFTYNGVEQRGCVAVKTQPLALSGRYLWFINTHVEYYIWDARQSQIAQLNTFIQGLMAADPTAVFVVTGDFNGGSEDAGYATMARTFKNSWQEFNGGNPAGGFTYPANWISYRFDHIWFYAPSDVTVTVKDVKVLEPQNSDHRALQAVLSFSTKKNATPAPPVISATSAPVATPKPATNAPAATPKPATNAPTATPKPATNAPAATSKPATTKPATTKPATNAPSTPAPSTGSCSASVVTSSSATPLVITNTGSKAIKSLVISFSPSIPSNNWNLVSAGSNQYSLPDWAYQSLVPGASFSSAGFYTTGAVPTATVVSVIC